MRQWTMNLPQTMEREGRTFRVSVGGVERSDGTWEGRLLFTDGDRQVATGQETSQPNREALEYWATGLERIYLDGALQRAIEHTRRGSRS